MFSTLLTFPGVIRYLSKKCISQLLSFKHPFTDRVHLTAIFHWYRFSPGDTGF